MRAAPTCHHGPSGYATEDSRSTINPVLLTSHPSSLKPQASSLKPQAYPSLKPHQPQASMSKTRQVALIMKSSQRYDRRIVRGVAARVHETGNWSLYVGGGPPVADPGVEILAVRRHHRRLRRSQDGRNGRRSCPFPSSASAAASAGTTTTRASPTSRPTTRRSARSAPNTSWTAASPDSPTAASPRTGSTAGRRCAAERSGAGSRSPGSPVRRSPAESEPPGNGANSRANCPAWLASLDTPVGLMTCNDIRARHVLEACRHLGVRVPDDVAVVGVDNDEVMCELTKPPLTSIEQGSRQIGYEAALLLERLIDGEDRRWPPDPAGARGRRRSPVDRHPGHRGRRGRPGGCLHPPVRVRSDPGLGRCCGSWTCRVRRWTREFRATLGRTVHAEMQRVRIDEAKRLLATTEMPIREIAPRRSATFSTSRRFPAGGTRSSPHGGWGSPVAGDATRQRARARRRAGRRHGPRQYRRDCRRCSVGRSARSTYTVQTAMLADISPLDAPPGVASRPHSKASQRRDASVGEVAPNADAAAVPRAHIPDRFARSAVRAITMGPTP